MVVPFTQSISDATTPDLMLAIQLFPDAASTSARETDFLYIALLVFSSVLTLLIMVFIARFLFHYHLSSNVDRSHPIQATWKYEITWTLVPTIIALGLFAWAARLFYGDTRIPADTQPVYVVAKQWMWKIQYPQGPNEINALHVPVGRPTTLVMTSQDVIHSFYVPAFRLKQDVLPERYTHLSFTPTRVGTYRLYCAEYCGDGHSRMKGYVYVMSEAAYARWLSGGATEPAPVSGTPGTPTAPMALRGRGIFFATGCNQCHTPQAEKRAPRLDGLWGGSTKLNNGVVIPVDRAYLRESIVDPQAAIVAGYAQPSIMPTYRSQLSESEINELVEFIRSIHDGWPDDARDTSEGSNDGS